MALLYTKFQHNRTYTLGGVIRKRKSLQTGRRTDAEGYNIIRPFFKRANKKQSGQLELKDTWSQCYNYIQRK